MGNVSLSFSQRRSIVGETDARALRSESHNLGGRAQWAAQSFKPPKVPCKATISLYAIWIYYVLQAVVLSRSFATSVARTMKSSERYMEGFRVVSISVCRLMVLSSVKKRFLYSPKLNEDVPDSDNCTLRFSEF